jgi:TIR domain
MIAISYRREDSLPIAGRLYDRLQAKFGRQNVFMDFDSIRPGLDFREQIRQTIERSDLVIAMIGPHWLGEQPDGSRKIDNPNDFVRLEIDYALKKGIPVVPVLVSNTSMPQSEKLPPDIDALAFRHGLPLDSGLDFHQHTDRLINSICGLVDDAEKQRQATAGVATTATPPPRHSNVFTWSAYVLAFATAVALFVWVFTTNHRPKISETQPTLVTQQPTPAANAEPQQTNAPQTTPASIQTSAETPNAQPGPIPPRTISIQNCAVSVNGVLVRNVATALGKPERVEYTHRGAEVDLWDSFGVRVSPGETSDSYRSFDIFISGEEKNRVTNSPEKNYQGELKIDGFPISSTTNIKALNANLGSKALTHTDNYGGGDYPVYRGQYGEGGIEVICNSKGIIEIVYVYPGGLPKAESSSETSQQRSAKAFSVEFLNTVKKGDLNAAYKHFQHTSYDPKSFTPQGFKTFIHEDEALSDIKSFRVTRATWDMGTSAVSVEVTRTDGRKRNVNLSLLAMGERAFEVSGISSGPEGATHEFPNYREWGSTLTGAAQPTTTSVTTDMVREVARKFVSAGQLDRVDDVLGLYTPNVEYRGEGQKDQTYIRQDLEKYHQRWPIRHDEIDGDIAVNETNPGQTYDIEFKLTFYVESRERFEWVKGQVVVGLRVNVVHGELKIAAVTEKPLHRESGKFRADNSNSGQPSPAMSEPTATSGSAPSAPRSAVVYKHKGKQKLTPIFIKAIGFTVLIPTDIFPDASKLSASTGMLDKGIGLVMPGAAVGSVSGEDHTRLYFNRDAGSFSEEWDFNTARKLGSMTISRTFRYKVRGNNWFIVQQTRGIGDAGGYTTVVQKGNAVFTMSVDYIEGGCPVSFETLKAMSQSFVAR